MSDSTQKPTYACDSMVFIYFFEGSSSYYSSIKKLFLEVGTHRVKMLTSTVSLTELLSYPLLEKVPGRLEFYRQFFAEIPGLETIPVSLEIADQAARLRRQYGFKTPDALQLATALVHRADVFLTNDRALANCKEIKVALLDTLTA